MSNPRRQKYRANSKGRFDDNMELVTVWTDYMIAVNWMYNDGGKKWIAKENGKKWTEKYYSIKDE
jgi:hypothetical protein